MKAAGLKHLLSNSALILLFALVGCAGSDSITRPQAHRDHANSQEQLPVTGFRLEPGTMEPQTSGGSVVSYSLASTVSSAETSVQITAAGCSGIKAAYFRLEYDQRTYIPVAAEPRGRFAAEKDLLVLAVLDEPGVVHYGQVLGNWDEREGLSGDLVLAEVRFKKAADVSPDNLTLKQTSTPPNSDASAVSVSYGSGGGYSWPYANQGDYNQDGLVSINDLTPLGLFFNQVGPFFFYSRQWMVDGNGDGEISINDITPIGLNFGNSALGGYNVYQTANMANYPAENDAADTVIYVDNVPLAATTSDRTTSRMEFFRFVSDPPGTDPFYVWVRPVDGDGNPGTPSQALFREIGPPSELVLVTPATGGTGTNEDPFILDPATVYEVSVVHPVRGDVSNDPGTWITPVWFGSIVPGTVNQAANTLTLNAEFTGRFRMQADVNGVATEPAVYMRVPDPDNTAPTASFTTDLSSGVAPFTVQLNASGSSDSDGSIVLYEWDKDDDHVYESQGTSPTASVTFTDGGEKTVRLRVTDDDGAPDVTTRVVQSEGWRKRLVDPLSGSGKYPSLTLIDGNPAISFIDPAGNVVYSRAVWPDGSAWSITTVPESSTASQVMMMEVDGRPAIVYKRSAPGDSGIRYVIGDSAAGIIWESRDISTGAEDHSPSLQLINGHPAIAYIWDNETPPENFQLLYIRSADATGTGPGAWDSFPSVLRAAEQFRMDNQSLIRVQLKPAIIYLFKQDVPGQQWKAEIVVANDIGATSWAAPTTIGSGSIDIGMDYLAVTSINVRPNIAFRKEDNGAAVFQRTDDIAAVIWEGIYAIPDTEAGLNRGYFLDIADMGGYPAICHYDVSASQLRYMRNSDPPGGEGWDPVVIDDVGTWNTNITHQAYVSLLAVVGQPKIAYYDAAEGHLMYADFYELP